MRERLPRAEATDYQTLRSNDAWSDHRARTLVTAALIAWLQPKSLLDPACGDASIVIAANLLRGMDDVFVADISKPNIERVGLTTTFTAEATDIETAIEQVPPVDVIVLTEILEHLEDPDHVLRMARDKSKYLVASSPEMRSGQVDSNPEHLWQFDRTGYSDMLNAAGWYVEQYTFLQFYSEYDFGIWVCK